MDAVFIVVAFAVLMALATLWGHDSRESGVDAPGGPRANTWW